jgi:hypothetical protein
MYMLLPASDPLPGTPKQIQPSSIGIEMQLSGYVFENINTSDV